MIAVVRDSLDKNPLHGRVIQTSVGKNGYSKSNKMTMGFARYSAEYGIMEPHRHAEEICYVLDCKLASIRFGSDADRLEERLELSPGMILHIPEMEYHVFEYGKDGYVDIMFFYGQVDHIRPEEE